MLYTKAEIQQKDGKITGIASSSVQDRQGEVVDVEGWDLKNFKRAPRLLWAHDHNEPAIGKVTRTYYEGEGKKKRLMFEAVFHEITEKARAVKQLVQEGFINTFSVGFKPVEMEGNTITKSELLEISVVNVPANPEAMVLAVKSLKDEGFKEEVIEEVIKIEPDFRKELDKLKERLGVVEETAELAVKGLEYLNPRRSKQEVVSSRLHSSKVIAKAADKLLSGKLGKDKTISTAKIIKRSSEMLIRSHKGDLNGPT